MSDKPVACLIRFTPEQKEALTALAKADDRSLSYMVRKAVDFYLEQQRDD